MPDAETVALVAALLVEIDQIRNGDDIGPIGYAALLFPFFQEWRGERRGRTAPAQDFDVLEKGRIGAQGREILEEQSKLALFTENVRREIFNPTVAVQKLDRGVDATEQGLAEEEALKKGMEEKSREFTEKGCEL